MRPFPETLPRWRRQVTDADSLAWADLLRDENPLHADAAAASASGLGGGLVVPGPAGIGYLATMLLETFPGASIRRLESKFVAPVIAPTEVVASGVVETRERVGGHELAHVALQLHAGGTLAVTARAVVRLPGTRP